MASLGVIPSRSAAQLRSGQPRLAIAVFHELLGHPRHVGHRLRVPARVDASPGVAAPIALPEARAWIQSLIAGRDEAILVATDRHSGVLEQVVAAHPRLRGNPVHDLHIATLMMEHGVPEIRTADLDFHQFPFLSVVNPFAGS